MVILLQPLPVLSISRVMATHQLPEVLGVVWVDQVAQLMDHHIVSDGMGCLDDVPVEDHLTLFVAGPPTGPEVADTHPRW